MRSMALEALVGWSPRRWAVAVGAALVYVLVVGIPTDLIPNPVFGREIPPTWWSWPALVASAALAGLLAATYVDQPPGVERQDEPEEGTRAGVAGSMLTFFAVGCPVCNKLVLLALGYAGAITWFEPVQPLLQIAAVGLLGWALRTRLVNEWSCPLPSKAGVR